MHASPSRRNRIATLVAAGVIGFGGVAAAGPGSFLPSSDDPFVAGVPEDKPVETTETTEPAATTSTTEAAPTTQPATTQAATTLPVTTEAIAVAPLVDDPETEFDETLCADGNHGETVSSVAHATESGPGKGEIVSTAAQSSCGKDATDDGAEDADEVDTEDVDDADDDSDEGGRPDHAGKPDGAGSRSNRNGDKHDDD